MLPETIKALILDMDGVIWRESHPIGDLPWIFRRIAELGLGVTLATNNSTRTPQQYTDRLREMGVALDPAQVVTSSQAAAMLLAQRFPAGGPIFAIGEDGLLSALRAKGFEALPVERAEEAQALVTGIDRQVNFEKMREAVLLVRAGRPFYITNPDLTFPTPRGEIPGAGSWAAVIIAATNVQPIVAGKPQPALIELALQRLGTRPAETLVVGDRIETDIAAGQALGCPTALVLSGVSTRAMGAAWQPAIDIIAEDLTELLR